MCVTGSMGFSMCFDISYFLFSSCMFSREWARCCNVGEYENHVSTYILVLVWYVLLIQFILNRSLLSITKKYSMVLLQLVLVVATGTKFGDRLIFIVSFSICVNVCGGGLCQRRQSIFSFYQHNQSSKIVNCHNQAKQSREIYFKMQFT